MTLLNGLDFKGKCGEEAELVKALYTSKIKKVRLIKKKTPNVCNYSMK